VNACIEVQEAPQEVNAGKGNSEEEKRADVREIACRIAFFCKEYNINK
jgi:hypothetical protein